MTARAPSRFAAARSGSRSVRPLWSWRSPISSIAAAVVVFVTANLTDQIDDRLVHALARRAMSAKPGRSARTRAPRRAAVRPGRLLLWTIESRAKYGTSENVPELPARLPSEQRQPADDHDRRRRVRERPGASVGDDYVVVAQTLDSVAGALDDRRGGAADRPILLAVVFLGAVAIGRRVAAPIDVARRRQLEFTADASHELRTRSSVIEAHTSLALTQRSRRRVVPEAFVRVDHESKRMRRMLDDLLWLARFDATRRRRTWSPWTWP